MMGAIGDPEQTTGRSNKQIQGVPLLCAVERKQAAQRRGHRRCQIRRVAKRVRVLDVLKAELSGLARYWVWGRGEERIPGCLVGVGPECWRQNDASRCVIGGQNRPGKYRPSDHFR